MERKGVPESSLYPPLSGAMLLLVSGGICNDFTQAALKQRGLCNPFITNYSSSYLKWERSQLTNEKEHQNTLSI